MPSGSREIRNFGREASATERDRVGAALLAYLQASEDGDWPTACTYASAYLLNLLQQFAATSEQLAGKGCAEVLALLTKAAGTEHPNTARAGVSSVRVEGDKAFALYRGSDGTSYSMPMSIEAGEWKVDSLAPNPLRP